MFAPIHRKGLLRELLSGWTWRMAWRDSRTSRRKLALFSCSIVLGIAALAAIGSLNGNLSQAIAEQTKALLGADLVINARDPFTPEQEAWLQRLGGVQSREITLSSMIFFAHPEGTRLVQVRALQGEFPFYGKMETDPPQAEAQFRRGGGALADDTLLQQFDAKVGDEIRLGQLTTRVIGRLVKVPGETVALAAVAPRVYISMDDLPRTGLLQPTSLARYRVYCQYPAATNVTALVERLQPDLDRFHFGNDTVAQRQRDLGRSLDNLNHFLNLVGFIALLLGGVGVASAIHVHIKQKLATVAVLRCLGGSIAQTFAVYLGQGMALGAFGAMLGGALGIAIQTALPRVLADFIPFTFAYHTAWFAVARAMSIGFIVCLLFTLLPLLTVRRVSPLAALRLSFEPAPASGDPLSWLVKGCLAAGILLFAMTQTGNWKIGLGFSVGLGVVFALLAGTAQALVFATRRFVPAGLPFTVRQGVANLHRPDNRTLLLLLSLGLGTFLMMSLWLIQQNLLSQLIATAGPGQPNAVLFDIQKSQRDPVRQLLRSLNIPLLDEAPVVTMRLASVKGRPVESFLANTNPGRDNRRWAWQREYRSTWRDHLRDGEKVVAGQWTGHFTGDPAATNPVPVSLEKGIAEELQVKLGDEIVFDVQGVPVTTHVSSLREVEWRRIQPNFFVVFPEGVLEDAPAMRVFVLHVNNSAESARLQREVVKAFPNVSALDLTLVLQTVQSILGKISFVIRFLALFTVLTGLLVLVTALLSGRYQRLRESVLLRTLGASRRQILQILLVEYFSLGFLSAVAGIALAVLAAWALARFVFDTTFTPSLLSLLVALAVVPALTLIVGLLTSRGLLDHPPLTVLRSEN